MAQRVRPSGHLTSFDTEGWFHETYEKAQKITGMGGSDNQLRRQRHYTLNHLAKYALSRVEGDVCEIGCWRGLSSYQIARRIHESNSPVTMHVFDSFQGLSPFESEDLANGENENVDLEAIRQMVACPLPVVQDHLKEFDFINYHEGWVPDRFPEVATSTFCFVHIDVDLYQPIRDSFSFFYPKLSPGGIMVFDDYGFLSFPGAKQAVDDLLSEMGNPLFLPLPSGQAFLIKD